jgi:hypothetical protein
VQARLLRMALDEEVQKFSVIIEGNILVFTAGFMHRSSVIWSKSCRVGRRTDRPDLSDKSWA